MVGFGLLTAGHCLPVHPRPPSIPTAFRQPLQVPQFAAPETHLQEQHHLRGIQEKLSKGTVDHAEICANTDANHTCAKFPKKNSCIYLSF